MVSRLTRLAAGGLDIALQELDWATVPTCEDERCDSRRSRCWQFSSSVHMRTQFDDLQRQLRLGQVVELCGGGLSRVTVSLNAQLSAIGGFNDTISNAGTRISLVNTALGGNHRKLEVR